MYQLSVPLVNFNSARFSPPELFANVTRKRWLKLSICAAACAGSS